MTPIHAPFAGGEPRTALKEVRGVIEHAIRNHPRSLQTTIGPSEIGTACDHCLAAKLAGWPQTEDVIPWLPTVGTAVHTWIECAFIDYENARNSVHEQGRRYLTEQRVMVGTIAGVEVWGSLDLIDRVVGMTVDWKIVGVTTLRSAKSGPSPVYRVQQHLYAKGCNDAGVRVDHVAIAYLPRNAVTLDAAVWWVEDYDEAVAVAALDRANRLTANLTALASISEAAVASYVAGLAREKGCRDCGRFPDAPISPSVLVDLLG